MGKFRSRSIKTTFYPNVLFGILSSTKVGFRKLDMSGFRMANYRAIVEWRLKPAILGTYHLVFYIVLFLVYKRSRLVDNSKTWPFDSRTCFDHLNTRLFLYSDGYCIQWGSEIWPSLGFEWSKRGWVANGLDLEWDLNSGSPTIWNPVKWPPFCQKPFEIRTKTSRFRMVDS